MPDTPTLSQIILVALADLRDPDWNPRDFFDEEEMQNLMDFIQAGGRIEPIVIWTPSPENAEDEPIGPAWAVISGKRRREAYRRLGRTHIEAIPMDTPLKDAMFMALAANRDSKPFWLSEYKRIEGLKLRYGKLQQVEIIAKTGWKKKRVSYAVNLMALLNPASRKLIFQSAEKKVPARNFSEGENTRESAQTDSWRLTEDVAIRLIPLLDEKAPEASQAKAEQAVRIVIDHQLTGPQTGDLVAFALAGGDIAQYQPTAKVKKARTPSSKKSSSKPKAGPNNGPTHSKHGPQHEASAQRTAPPSDEILAKVADLGRQLGLAEGRGEDTKTLQEQLNAYLAEIKTQTPVVPSPSYPVASPEGFALLKQKIGDMAKEVFKPEPKVEAIVEMEALKSLKWFEKLTRGFVKFVWHKFLAYQHRACKEIAKLAVPEHYTHSGQTHSGHGSRRGKGLTTLALALLHWTVYGVCQFVFWWAVTMGLVSLLAPGLRPWFEWPFRFAARLVLDVPAWVWAWAQGPGHFWPAFGIAIVLLVLISKAHKVEPTRVWILCALILAGLFYGHRWAFSNADMASPIGDKLAQPSLAPPLSGTGQLEASTQVPVRSEELESSRLKNSNASLPTHHSPLAAAYQPAVSFIPSPSSAQTLSPMNTTGISSSTRTQYDPKLFELEIAAIPKNSIVKDYPMTPDEGMPADLAVSRMQDLTDADKYTMMIGGSKQIIKTVNATNSTLTISYKSTDPFDVLGGGKDPLNFFWEDLKYIHVDEIDVISARSPTANAVGDGSGTQQPNIIYQCSLVVSGAKYPLTIQCASAGDLEHLVSTMEFFIRTSRLAHDTALAGMPYPSQGLRLNNDRVVEKLWSNSPADKGLSLGDHLWSVGKPTSEQQEKKVLEAGLSPNQGGLSSLPVTVFVASGLDWDNAQMTARQSDSTNNVIHPKLRKVVISL